MAADQKSTFVFGDVEPFDDYRNDDNDDVDDDIDQQKYVQSH